MEEIDRFDVPIKRYSFDLKLLGTGKLTVVDYGQKISISYADQEVNRLAPANYKSPLLLQVSVI